MQFKDERCIQCNRTSDEVPLLVVHHQGQEYFICPQDLPILIHKPAQLSDKLPGAANLGAPEGH